MMQISDCILHNDHHLLVCNKPSGIPVQEDKSGDASLLRMTQAYCKRDLYPVNRLDRPCSGLVLFAKTKSSARLLNEQLKNREVEKQYLAIVSGNVDPAKGGLRHFLSKFPGQNRMKAMQANATQSNASVLHYRVLEKSERYTLIEVQTDTGVQHQVRAQLGAAGWPIRGDEKYGFKRANKDRSVQLHCWKMSFHHPSGGELAHFLALPPASKIWRIFQYNFHT